MQLRAYQQKLISEIHAAWANGEKNVCAVLPTGGGKTVCFGTVLQNHEGAAVAIAHRRELVGQMSVTLARLGVRHRIIAPNQSIREIVTLQMRQVGKSFFDPNAKVAVAGVDTLVRRDDLGKWPEQVGLWVTDEAHHLLIENKWGKALAAFPNAKGLGVTATPVRADGKGLGRHNDGLFDRLIIGPDMRDLIDGGFLAEYRIFAPKSDIDLANVPVSATTGDFSAPQLRKAAEKSHITGDVVKSYLKIAPGKLGVTFCVSVEIAQETATQFRAAGIAAEAVSAATPDLVRAETLRRFSERKILQLVNVDLFGEGFDLPAVEVISMARPTASFGLYCQQFGRVLRPMEGKTHAIVIDHVGNVLRHGLPDAPRVWNLDRREKRDKKDKDELKIKVCKACTGVFERFHKTCPYCGHKDEPISRAGPKFVDGDLLELDPGVLLMLRKQASKIYDQPLIPYGATPVVAQSIRKRHQQRLTAQENLRDKIALWAGWKKALGGDDGENYRKFYFDFGVDVATAQTLNSKETLELAARLDGVLKSAGVTAMGGKNE